MGALRAHEIGAQVVMAATMVDGIYDKDPQKFPDATKFDRLTYEEIQPKPQVMDQTAIALCREHCMPILVFDMREEGNILRAAKGEPGRS